LLGKQYEATKRRYGGDRRSSSHNEDLNKGRTAIRVSEEMGVSGSTVERAGQFSSGLDAIGASEPKLKIDILSGKVSVPKMDIQSIARIPEPERPAAIERIKRGERVSIKPPVLERPAAHAGRRGQNRHHASGG